MLQGESPTQFIPQEERPVHPIEENYAPGFRYADRYLILEFLGRGGMGTVYCAFDEAEKRNVALKILHPWIARETGGPERFQREAELLSKIVHSSVPRFYGFGFFVSDMYFVAEYVEGQDLKRVIEIGGPMPLSQTVRLITAIADALDAAHKQGIVHRDVKPSNIMIGSDSVHLLDFGIARSTTPGMDTLTRTGIVLGTPEYMSPEHFDSHTVDARSDIYSLGVVLFEMLTARLPFEGQSPLSIAMKHKVEPAPPPRTIRNDIPDWMNFVVLRCLEKDPAKRFDSMAELAAHIRKPRSSSNPKRLQSGDVVMEDSTSKYPLVLSSTSEKSGWHTGMTLLFQHVHMKLQSMEPPAAPTEPWTYRFTYWPAQEAFRAVVDYEHDWRERKAAQEKRLGAKLRKLIGSD